MRVLITGYGGFAGGHLAQEILAATDWRVWGTVLPGQVPAQGGNLLHGQALAHSDRESSVEPVPADLRDPAATRAVVQAVAPDMVFHLAGQAFVPAAWADPWATFETNVRMQLNLLEAVAGLVAAGQPVRVVTVISNEIYGRVPVESLPTDERWPLAPANPYATSKAAQDLVAGQYVHSHQLDVVRVRPFNHIGPHQDPRFVLPSFARQIAEIEAGLRPPVLQVGNLDAERDFTDVRDIVRGYRLAAEHGRAGEAYNLGSGRARPIRAIVDTLLARASTAIAVTPDPERMRPSDVPRTECDAGKARRELGWQPEISFEQTVADVLDEWRARVAADAVAVAG